jgi:hypothetical protein
VDGTPAEGQERILGAQARYEAAEQAADQVAAATSWPAESAAQSDLQFQAKHLPLDDLERIPGDTPRNSPLQPKATGVLRKRVQLSLVVLGLVVVLAVMVSALSQCGGSAGEQFPPDERYFLDTVHRSSPVEGAPPFAAWPDDRTLVAEGHAICHDLRLHRRASFDQTWARLSGIDSYLSTYTMDQSLQLDANAHMTLCPAF